jgi:hypothetical protein
MTHCKRLTRISAFVLAACGLLLGACAGQAGTAARPDFKSLKYGFFVHYVWGGAYGQLTKDAAGQQARSLDDLANRFNVEGFANDLTAWQVEYVIFTAWHANINPLFPSQTMKKWGLESHFCQRDLLGELITACNARGIQVMFYTHPRDGHDLRGEEQVKTGWGASQVQPEPDWAKFDFKKWNNFVNDLYGELVERYGDRIVGVYLDEGSGAGDSFRVVDYSRLRATIKRNHPHLVMVQNYYGNLYSCDVGDKEYYHWGEFANRDGSVWPVYKMCVGTCFASIWWASTPAGTNAVWYTPEDMFRYTVLQAGANTDGGGVQWATGPYPGGGWETGVDETMRKLGACIKAVAPSVKGTYASRAYPTPAGSTLKSVAWGSATDAADGTATFLHVLKPPAARTLAIGKAANGTLFTKASLLTSGKKLEFRSGANGFEIVLPDDAEWDKLDTVIQLKTDSKQLQHRRRQARERLAMWVTALSAALAGKPDAGSWQFESTLAWGKRVLANKQSNLTQDADATTAVEAACEDLARPPLPAPELNLAAGKAVETSSCHPSVRPQTLTTGQRGDPAFWSNDDAKTSVDHHEWAKLDLGREETVGCVALFPRAADGGDGFPLDLAISLSADGSTWREVLRKTDAPHPRGNSCTYAFAAEKARYVKIEGTRLRQMPGDENRFRMQLARIEVFAPATRK